MNASEWMRYTGLWTDTPTCPIFQRMHLAALSIDIRSCYAFRGITVTETQARWTRSREGTAECTHLAFEHVSLVGKHWRAREPLTIQRNSPHLRMSGATFKLERLLMAEPLPDARSHPKQRFHSLRRYCRQKKTIQNSVFWSTCAKIHSFLTPLFLSQEFADSTIGLLLLLEKIEGGRPW